MYHRFNESKYPSTNIQMDVFKKQLDIIESEGIKFIHPKDFKKSLSENKKDRKIAGKTVSPSGLYFLGPKYPNNFDIPNFKNNFI